MDDNNIYCITAHLDLLGFSSHLVLSSYDLRTKIGNEAFERLKILDQVISIINKEMVGNTNSYPESFRIMRFNDSLILGIDIDKAMIPKIGQPNEGETIILNEIKKKDLTKAKSISLSESIEERCKTEAFKVAQFIGIVSRIHNYVNNKEFEIH